MALKRSVLCDFKNSSCSLFRPLIGGMHTWEFFIVVKELKGTVVI